MKNNDGLLVTHTLAAGSKKTARDAWRVVSLSIIGS